MDSTYSTECGYKGTASQPTSQPASQSERLTSASQSVLERQTDLYNNYIYIIVIYHSLNDLHRFRRRKNNRKVDSTCITECGCKGSQPVSL